MFRPFNGRMPKRYWIYTNTQRYTNDMILCLLSASAKSALCRALCTCRLCRRTLRCFALHYAYQWHLKINHDENSFHLISLRFFSREVNCAHVMLDTHEKIFETTMGSTNALIIVFFILLTRTRKTSSHASANLERKHCAIPQLTLKWLAMAWIASL